MSAVTPERNHATRYRAIKHSWSPEALANFRAQAAARRRPMAERYWEKVDKRGPDECWNWLGSLHGDGYGLIGNEQGKCSRAHRFGWEAAGNELPPSAKHGHRLVLDHLCKNRACQNPAHMRVVTQGVNSTENSSSPHAINKAKTRCIRGHALSGDNIIWIRRTVKSKSGKPKVETARVCIVCRPFLANSKLRIEAPK